MPTGQAASRSRRRSWKMTEQREVSARRGQSPEESPPRIKTGAGDERLLDVLVQPMRGSELQRLLNLSRQRIYQIVAKLMALGLLRVGDPKRVTLIVARHDDPTVLLPYSGELVLSSLMETEETSASSLATRLRTPLEEILNQLSWLADQGLVRQTGESPKGPH